jgi:hypothetical protein
MTTALKERNILVKDADGVWYSIPPDLEREFIRIKEDTINYEFGSSDWHDSVQEMRDSFESFIK